MGERPARGAQRPTEPAHGSLNQNVYIWAHSRVGQHVGRGECWDLADAALTHAGAQSSTSRSKNDDYVWGNRVPLEHVIPGDILQFRDFVILLQTDSDVAFQGGGGYRQHHEERHIRPHHTAIVESVIGPNELSILEQLKAGHNQSSGRVLRHVIQLRSGTKATTVFKTIAEKSQPPRPAKVLTTTKITVTGTVRAYRPRAQP